MHRRHHSIGSLFGDIGIASLWESFWYPPKEICPKCKKAVVVYYDPFFFSPLRTLRGRRRVKCKTCRFIWRPKRT